MPTTPNRKLSIPTTGSEVGVWGSNDLNPNFAIIDSISGSVTTLNLAGSGPVTLTDTQQQVAIIRLTGILTGNVQITVTEPAFWIIDNRTSGNFVVTLTGGAGQVIATPQGSKYQVAFDGTDVFFVNLGEPGTYKKFAVSTIPLWIPACTIPPYLSCQGGTALIATFPTLAALLGTTFGGNGITTFGLPDRQGRADFDLDPTGTRLTSATMTPNGNTLGAIGGNEKITLVAGQIPQMNTGVESVPHTHPYTGPGNVFGINAAGGGGSAAANPTGLTTGPESVTHFHTVGTASPAIVDVMDPAIITGITFLKT